jgi:hypothetical protein
MYSKDINGKMKGKLYEIRWKLRKSCPLKCEWIFINAMVIHTPLVAISHIPYSFEGSF